MTDTAILLERFWSFVPDRPEHGCWPWAGTLDHKGYGRFRYDGVRCFATRAIVEFLGGVKLQRSQWVCHHCDNPACVRPDHLYIGNAKTNADDMVNRGRHPRYNASKTHCKRGHPFDKANTRVTRIGTRRCLECERAADNKRRMPTRRSVSGFVGVKPWRNRWIAKIGRGGRTIHLGVFATPYEASLAYQCAKAAP